MSMTRRERLTATFRGMPVDRPAVSFYEIGGFRYDPDDPDPYNVHNDPSWRPLIRFAEEKTDIMRLVSGKFLPRHPEAAKEFVRVESWEEGRSLFTRTRLKIAGRVMMELTRRDADTDTVWKIEHFLKDEEDLKAYLGIPEEALDCAWDCSDLPGLETALGETGIVMIDAGDPLCAAADMFSMEDYTVMAFSQPRLFNQLLQRFARRIHRNVEKVSGQFPGRLWRIYGSEYASEPYLPPSLYKDFFVTCTGPMVKMIQKHGGFARIHSHGRLRSILPHLASMGIDGLDPVEPPPHGDIELIEVRKGYGRDMVLLGNIEVTDIENLQAGEFEKKVAKALHEGTTGEGRGFVLMPSACPYGRRISPKTMTNYETMVRLAENWF